MTEKKKQKREKNIHKIIIIKVEVDTNYSVLQPADTWFLNQLRSTTTA